MLMRNGVGLGDEDKGERGIFRSHFIGTPPTVCSTLRKPDKTRSNALLMNYLHSPFHNYCSIVKHTHLTFYSITYTGIHIIYYAQFLITFSSYECKEDLIKETIIKL